MSSRLKYRALKKCLLGLVLLVFGVGTFNQGIFEIIHILSHQLSGGYTHHTHHSDLENTDHEHVILDLTEIAFERDDHTPNRPDQRLQLSYDKIPKICPSIVVHATSAGEPKHKITTFFYLRVPPTPYLQIPTPPPNLVIG